MTLPCFSLCGNMHDKKLCRFHFTCLYCRLRRKLRGTYTEPAYYITYTYPWHLKRVALVSGGKVIAYRTRWITLRIDPRGHFTMLRCSTIVALDKIMQRYRVTRKLFTSLCELISNYPTW